jgi:hypothetical protein
MGGPWPQNAVFSFLFALPVSIVAWTYGTLGMGWLRLAQDQPRWFRFIAARMEVKTDSDRPPNWNMVAIALAIWSFVNVLQLASFVMWPFGWLGRAVFLMYFVVQAIWVLGLRRSVRRSFAERGDR